MNPTSDSDSALNFTSGRPLQKYLEAFVNELKKSVLEHPGRKIEWQDLTRIIRLIISDLIRSDENRTQNRRLRFLTLSRIRGFL